MPRRFTVAAVCAAAAVVTVLAVVVPDAGRSDASPQRWSIGVAIRPRHASPTPVKSTPAPVRTTTPAPVKTTTPPPTPTASPTSSTPGPATPTTPFMGTLVTHADTAPQESQAGVKMAMLEFSWKAFEPKQGVYDTGYASYMAKQLAAYRAAGMRVTLGLGLHYAPAWALSLPGSRMVDEHGNVSGQLDLVFNQTLRDLAADYIAHIDKTVGLANFWAVRITSGGFDEMMYPTAAYWAYSAGAQNAATKPPSMAPNPMPGWKPGQSATSAQRDAWARWYIGALDNVAEWQIDEVTSFGFHGYSQIVTPGQGLRPTQYTKAVDAGLPDGLLGRGAVWDLVYAGLKGEPNVTAYVSSVADGSGNDDVCQPSDSSVALNTGTAYYFSATRYIARIAAIDGFTVAGEVPGYPSDAAGRSHYVDPSSKGLLATAMAQARGCGLLGLYWAHDDQVWNGTIALSRLAQFTTPNAVAPAMLG